MQKYKWCFVQSSQSLAQNMQAVCLLAKGVASACGWPKADACAKKGTTVPPDPPSLPLNVKVRFFLRYHLLELSVGLNMCATVSNFQLSQVSKLSQTTQPVSEIIYTWSCHIYRAL